MTTKNILATRRSVTSGLFTNLEPLIGIVNGKLQMQMALTRTSLFEDDGLIVDFSAMAERREGAEHEC